MGSVIQVQVGNYHFGLAQTLNDQQLQELVSLLEAPVRPGTQVLGGRARATTGMVSGWGRVAVKHYLRGGVLQYFVARRYSRLEGMRPRLELELLQRVRSFGIHAPEPLAYAYQGSLLYRAWLFTREIEEYRSLTELALSDDPKLQNVIDEVVRQVQILVEKRILHVDLHPGNVLIDRQGEVFLLDFDKAREYRGTQRQLRDHYLCRWRRAVIKHHLPEVVSEMISHRLRTI